MINSRRGRGVMTFLDVKALENLLPYGHTITQPGICASTYVSMLSEKSTIVYSSRLRFHVGDLALSNDCGT